MKATRLVLTLAAPVALALVGCLTEKDPAPGPLAPTRIVPVGFNLLAVGGRDSTIVTVDYNGNSAFPGDPFRSILRVFTHPAGSPTALSQFGQEVLDCGGDLALTADWVTGYGGYAACVVSLGGEGPTLVAGVVPGDVVVRAMASGRWLAIARTTWNGHVLEVRDLQAADLGFPRAAEPVPAGAPVTGLFEAPGGFLVVTSAGYGYLDVGSGTPVYAFTASDDLRLFEKGCVLDGIALLGGPSPIAGKSRVGRVDLSVPSAPSLAAHADLDGRFEGFACDDDVAVTIAATDVSTDHGPATLTHAVVHRDEGGTLVPRSRTELRGVRFGASPTQFHYSNGILYTPYMPDAYVSSWSALALFALP